jgi:hypothetical protein
MTTSPRQEILARRQRGLFLITVISLREQLAESGFLEDSEAKALVQPSYDQDLYVGLAPNLPAIYRATGRLFGKVKIGKSRAFVDDRLGKGNTPVSFPEIPDAPEPAAPAPAPAGEAPEDTSEPAPEPALALSDIVRYDPLGLFEELQRRRENSVDYNLAFSNMSVIQGLDGLALRIVNDDGEIVKESIPFTASALRQFSRVSPAKHFSRYWSALACDYPKLALNHANDLLERSPQSRVLVRTLDGRVRAVLSSSYRTLDNFSLAWQVAEVMEQRPDIELVRSSLSHDRLYMKLIDRSTVERVFPEGHQPTDHVFRGFGPHRDDDGGSTIHPCVTVSNSETGNGGLAVDIGIFVSGCANTCIVDRSIAKVHIGKRRTGEERLIISDDTKKLEDQVLWAKVKDAISAAFDSQVFQRLVKRLEGLQAEAVEDTAVDDVAAKLELSEARRDQLLKVFSRNNENTQFGLFQAVTEVSQEWGKEDQELEARAEAWAGALLAS